MIKNKGFTLIELLIVIAIIGIIATLIIVKINDTIVKGRDAKRLDDLKKIETSLEIFYQEKGHYPKVVGTGAAAYDWARSDHSHWLRLGLDLSDYISQLPVDPINDTVYRYYYNCDRQNNYQNYGLAIRPEHSSTLTKAAADGGYYPNLLEIGKQVKYCNDLGRAWLDYNNTSICQ